MIVFLQTYKWRILTFVLALGIVAVGILYWRGYFKKNGGAQSGDNVMVPTIINGELVLPKVTNIGLDTAVNLGKGSGRLGVVSANLVPVSDQQQKLTGIRILGETTNLGGSVVTGLSPVIRFIDASGKTIGQKIGRYSTGWDFFGVAPGEKTFYDVTVDGPPTADKLEIILNVSSASDSAVFDELKIASRSVELKTATYQGNASDSAAEKVEYYSVSGSFVNTLSDPVSDISIYVWVKDVEGKVYAFARQDFKNDLLAAGERIDFKTTLLPLKVGEAYDTYEVAAWGKRYRLNL